MRARAEWVVVRSCLMCCRQTDMDLSVFKGRADTGTQLRQRAVKYVY